MKNIIIAGGTGLIGSKLFTMLNNLDYNVKFLTTNNKKVDNLKYFYWNPENNLIDDKIFENANSIINLAGSGISNKRWNKDYKDAIYNSRINSTKLLIRAINRLNVSNLHLINASAIGIYKTNTEQPQDIYSELNNDFMAKVCKDWEYEASQITKGNSYSIIRIGIVLAKEGGALPKLAMPIKLGFGAPLASGSQLVPWIHITDLCNLFIHELERRKNGEVLNGVSPGIITNKDLTIAIAKQLRKPLFLPNIPGFVLKLAVGEFANSIIDSYNISAESTLTSGYTFRFNDIKAALADIYS
jgi:uncharacterized protein (TIGR01777 family)